MSTPVTLSATTAVGQLYELCNVLSESERANVDTDGTPLTDNIAISVDPETATATVALRTYALYKLTLVCINEISLFEPFSRAAPERSWTRRSPRPTLKIVSNNTK